jgi:hypothetical protein
MGRWAAGVFQAGAPFLREAFPLLKQHRRTLPAGPAFLSRRLVAVNAPVNSRSMARVVSRVISRITARAMALTLACALRAIGRGCA